MDNVLMQGRVEIFTFTASEKQSFENLSRRDGILGHQLDKRLNVIHCLSTGVFLKKSRLYFCFFLNYIGTKKSAKQENSNVFVNTAFCTKEK
jgi:hypothetical protein